MSEVRPRALVVVVGELGMRFQVDFDVVVKELVCRALVECLMYFI